MCYIKLLKWIWIKKIIILNRNYQAINVWNCIFFFFWLDLEIGNSWKTAYMQYIFKVSVNLFGYFFFLSISCGLLPPSACVYLILLCQTGGDTAG